MRIWRLDFQELVPCIYDIKSFKMILKGHNFYSWNFWELQSCLDQNVYHWASILNKEITVFCFKTFPHCVELSAVFTGVNIVWFCPFIHKDEMWLLLWLDRKTYMYRGFWTRMVYPEYITYLRYTILVQSSIRKNITESGEPQKSGWASGRRRRWSVPLVALWLKSQHYSHVISMTSIYSTG